MWCHVLLFGFPVLGLVLFWLFPLSVAVATYLPLSAFSVWLGMVVMRTLRSPVSTGAEALRGQAGRVVTVDGDELIVQVDGELWRARCGEPLAPEEPVDVIALDGLTLTVRPHSAVTAWDRRGSRCH
jgi:membrane protein implicated in regulation of membrane protease activity